MSRVSFMFSVHVVAVKCHDRNLLALPMCSFTHPHRARLVTWHTHNANPLPSSGDDVSLASGQPCGHTFCATWLGTHRGLLFFTSFMYHHSARYMASPPQAASSYLMSRQWLGIDMYNFCTAHHDDVIMCAITSQITSLTIVYSTVYSDADQRKHQSSASLAFVWGIDRGPVNSPHKWPVTRKMFPFDDVIMPLQSAHCPAATWASFYLTRRHWYGTDTTIPELCAAFAVVTWPGSHREPSCFPKSAVNGLAPTALLRNVLPMRPGSHKEPLVFPARRQWLGTKTPHIAYMPPSGQHMAWLPQGTSCFSKWHHWSGTDTPHIPYATCGPSQYQDVVLPV